MLARILGPGRTGTYSVALALALGLLTLGSLSLQTAIGYFVGSGRWAPRRALLESQLAAGALGLLMIGVALGLHTVARPAFRGLDLGIVILAAGSVPFGLSWSYASAVALAVDCYEVYALAAALQAVLSLVLVLTLGAIAGVAGAVAGFTLSHVACAAAILPLCARSVPRDDCDPAGHGSRLVAALKFGLKTHAANALTFVTYRADVFILNGNVGAAEVGQYAIAVSVTQAVWLLPNALGAVVLPRIAQLSTGRGKADSQYQEMVERKGVRHALIAGVASALCLLVALAVLVLTFLGARFHESIVLGSVLLPGSILLAVTAALAAMLSGRGRAEFALIVSLVMTPAAVVLYVVLIPPLGAMGAALASTLAYTIGFVVSLFAAQRMLKSSVLRLIVPTRSEFDDYRTLALRLRNRHRTAAKS